jgi:hypothetical protein
MRKALLALIAALALTACSSGQPEVTAAPVTPTGPPHYAPFADGRLCDSIRYDVLDGVVVDDGQPAEPFDGGLGLFCGSKGAFHIPTSNYGELPSYDGEQPMIGIRLYVFDSPEQAQQAFADKGIKPSLPPGMGRGDLDLGVSRAEWLANNDALIGRVFDGNMRIEAGLYGVAPKGNSGELLGPFTELLKELIADLHRMLTQS